MIELRFGLSDGVECTLRKSARILGVTRERVRQIQQKALLNLRKSAVSDRLRRLPCTQQPVLIRNDEQLEAPMTWSTEPASTTQVSDSLSSRTLCGNRLFGLVCELPVTNRLCRLPRLIRSPTPSRHPTALTSSSTVERSVTVREVPVLCRGCPSPNVACPLFSAKLIRQTYHAIAALEGITPR